VKNANLFQVTSDRQVMAQQFWHRKKPWVEGLSLTNCWSANKMNLENKSGPHVSGRALLLLFTYPCNASSAADNRRLARSWLLASGAGTTLARQLRPCICFPLL
jgi:hypothetical protein